MRAHRRCSARYSGSTNPPPSCCCVFICRCLGLTHPHPFPAISGRTRFFDAYGTTRDVLQNHLTEMMALVALAHEQPVNPAAKAAVLKQVITTTTTFCCTQTSPSFGRNAPRQSNNSPDNQPSPPPKKPSFLSGRLAAINLIPVFTGWACKCRQERVCAVPPVHSARQGGPR